MANITTSQQLGEKIHDLLLDGASYSSAAMLVARIARDLGNDNLLMDVDLGIAAGADISIANMIGAGGSLSISGSGISASIGAQVLGYNVELSGSFSPTNGFSVSSPVSYSKEIIPGVTLTISNFTSVNNVFQSADIGFIFGPSFNPLAIGFSTTNWLNKTLSDAASEAHAQGGTLVVAQLQSQDNFINTTVKQKIKNFLQQETNPTSLKALGVDARFESEIWPAILSSKGPNIATRAGLVLMEKANLTALIFPPETFGSILPGVIDKTSSTPVGNIFLNLYEPLTGSDFPGGKIVRLRYGKSLLSPTQNPGAAGNASTYLIDQYDTYNGANSAGIREWAYDKTGRLEFEVEPKPGVGFPSNIDEVVPVNTTLRIRGVDKTEPGSPVRYLNISKFEDVAGFANAWNNGSPQSWKNILENGLLNVASNRSGAVLGTTGDLLDFSRSYLNGGIPTTRTTILPSGSNGLNDAQDIIVRAPNASTIEILSSTDGGITYSAPKVINDPEWATFLGKAATNANNGSLVNHLANDVDIRIPPLSSRIYASLEDGMININADYMSFGKINTKRMNLNGNDVESIETLVHNDFSKNDLSVFRRDSTGSIVLDNHGLPVVDGFRDEDNPAIIHYTSGPKKGITTIKSTEFPIEFDKAGAILGSMLGKSLAGDNRLAQIATSSLLKTVGQTLGEIADSFFDGKEGTEIGDVLASFDENLFRNLQLKGVGVISSYISSELINAIGIDGFVGDVANTAVSEALRSSIANVLGIQSNNVIANVGNAVGSLIGQKLASELVSFDTVGGQIGAQIGSAIGTFAAMEFLKIGGALGGPLGAAIGAFAGFIIGGLIGSLFGGTPRSGADVVWDSATGAFTVANVYSKQGGSKKAARSMANAVADTYNGVLSAVGGTLLNPEAVQAGNYGMRKKSFVYRPVSSRDKEAITQRFSGKKGAEKLIGYGIYQGLSDPDFQIAGGDIYAKRALYNTFALGGLDPLDFDASVLMGNLASAQSYERYLANSTAVNALVAAEPDSVFAIETAITLARASELGLTRRAASDWVGGFNFLMNQAGTGPANVSFGFDYDPYSDKISRLIGVGSYVLGDAIDVAGQDVIEGGAGADTISLVNNQIADVRGLTVNGKLQNDIATTGSDFGAASGTLSFASGDLRKSFAIGGIANDGVAEGAESLLAKLSAASAMTIMGGAATVTIRDAGGGAPQLLVGRSFAAEGDYAVFRVSLSKALAAGTSVAVGLVIADGTATGAGADYGASAFQVSTDGNSWTTATSATFTATLSTVYVRTLTRADNSANPAYVPGNGQPQTLGIEGNEDFTLTATVTAGAAYVANTSASGKGTIVDASVTTLPLVWVDDVVVDEVVVDEAANDNAGLLCAA